MADKNTEIDSLYESMHQKDMAAIERKIAAAYRKAAEEASKLADIQIPGTSKAFSIDDYPQLKKKVSEILEDLHNRLQTIIVNGVESQWTLANNKNNELSRTVFGDNIGNLSEQQYSRYFSNNSNALQSFIMRTEAGLNLSQRVWKYTGAFKTEIEAALSIGIGTGKPAAEIAREVKSYLQNPDKLFRRVRDEKGNLRLSKAARNYHPGQGVYRSSYMNARRLAVTETNIAYRTSDYMRWQQLDFVVGIRICLSNNHNCRGVPAGTFRDICDQLSAPNKSTNTSGRGCYPKDFKFTGWHPHCRCHAITILKTDEEIAEDNLRILQGKEPSTDSVNTIKDVPDGFKQWVRDNKDRIAAAERKDKLPYFLKDNQNVIKKIMRTPSVFNETIEKLKQQGIDYLEVKDLGKTLTEAEIIGRIGGGDKTKGSCASLAFAYVANKSGLDVLDFRGGKSLDYFASRLNLYHICEKIGGYSSLDITGLQLLKQTQIGKTYYVAWARHAAIVRQVSKGKYEYMELQSATSNGWKHLDSKIMNWRFGGRGRDVGLLMDIELLQKDSGFRKMVGYINTAESKQNKGSNGTIK